MKQYIGTKLIEAEPRSKDGEEGYRVCYEDGYKSWSPAGVFGKAYHQLNDLDFGHALYFLKQGRKIARRGWNGKDMFIYMEGGYEIPASDLRGPAKTHVSSTLRHDDKIEIYRHIDMKAADGNIVVGWLASQTDMLAHDWEVVD